MKTPQDMQPGAVHQQKDGQLFVRAYHGKYEVDIEFMSTGTRRTARSSAIRRGQVKDPMHPSVCGVGYIGVGHFPSMVNYVETEAYRKWAAMLRRCYSEKEQARNPTYIGCTVCPEWHNFQNFAQWYYKQGKRGFEMHLDKDIRVAGNRVYSPATCKMVTAAHNSAEANSRRSRAAGAAA